MSRRAKAFLIACIAASLVAGGLAGSQAMRHHSSKAQVEKLGGPFSLVDQNGTRFTEANLVGKPTLLYFGYTFCPDVCPTALLLMETAAEMLGPDGPHKVNIVFITIDPERDTTEKLKGYVPEFGASIVGLTGSPEQVARAAKAYQVFYQKTPSRDDAPYLMAHSSTIYLLDRRGRYIGFFSHDSKAEDIAQRLRKLL